MSYMDKNRMYILAENCLPQMVAARAKLISDKDIDEEKKAYRKWQSDYANGTVSGEDEPVDRDYKIDNRIRMASYKTTMDIVTYFNYYQSVLDILISESYNYSATSVGRLMGLLDGGFVPIYMPPSFFDNDEFEKIFISKLEERGLTVYMESQYDIYGKSLHNGKRDVWASRMEICDKEGIRYDDFNILKFLQEVLN